jgi:dethiobiotin synthetase
MSLHNEDKTAKNKFQGFFVTSTDTGVGKTVITAGILGALRQRGLDAIAIKPIQSGGIQRRNELISEDAAFYGTVTDLPYSSQELNPVCLQAALAPSVAAEIEGRVITPESLLEHYEKIAARHQLTLVEGAGGILAPLIGTKFTVADLAAHMGLPLLIVARPNLGTVNHTCLTISYAQSRGLKTAGVIINMYDHENAGTAERTNPGLIEAMTGIPVLGLVPKVKDLSVEGETPQAGNLLAMIEEYIDLDQLLETISC